MYLWTQPHCPQWGHNLRHLSRLRALLTPGFQGLLAVSLATRLASVKPEKRVFLSVHPHLSAKVSTSRHCTIVWTIVQIGVGYAWAWGSQQCSQLAFINDFCINEREKSCLMFVFALFLLLWPRQLIKEGKHLILELVYCLRWWVHGHTSFNKTTPLSPIKIVPLSEPSIEVYEPLVAILSNHHNAWGQRVFWLVLYVKTGHKKESSVEAVLNWRIASMRSSCKTFLN